MGQERRKVATQCNNTIPKLKSLRHYSITVLQFSKTIFDAQRIDFYDFQAVNRL